MKKTVRSWGFVEEIVNCEEYCGKFIHVKKRKGPRDHYHLKKKETFYPLQGAVMLIIEQVGFELKEAYTIEPLVRHSFRGITDAIILEVATHDDEKDVVKWEGDKWIGYSS